MAADLEDSFNVEFFQIVLGLLGLRRGVGSRCYPRKAHMIEQIIDGVRVIMFAKFFEDIGMNIATR